MGIYLTFLTNENRSRCFSQHDGVESYKTNKDGLLSLVSNIALASLSGFVFCHW